MFSTLFPTLSLLLTLLTLTTNATPSSLDTTTNNDLLDARQAGYTWHITQFDAACANGYCHYEFTVRAGRQGEIPAFTATCGADNVPRDNRDFQDCTVTRGSRMGVQVVRAFVQLRPRRPRSVTRMVVEMGYNDVAEGGSTVTYWRGRQDGNYRTFRDLSQDGNFDVVPFKYAAVA